MIRIFRIIVIRAGTPDGPWHVSLGTYWPGAIVYIVLLALFAYACAHALKQVVVPYDGWTQSVINAVADNILDDEVVLPGASQVTLKDPVTVVLFGDGDLEKLGVAFPVPYETHAQILETILAYKPRAIFVDFVFLQQRRGDDAEALFDLICRTLEKQHPEVMIAIPEPGELEAREGWLGPRLGKCATSVTLTNLDPHRIAGQVRYPSTGKLGTDLKIPLTPAFAIARKYGLLESNLHDRPDPIMEIVWRSGLYAEVPTVEGCRERYLAERIRDLPNLSYTSTFCPFQPVVGAAALLHGDLLESTRRDRFEGRFVFYGGSFLGASDTVKTPIGAYTPGVFVHAMAFQNLLAFRDRYKREGGLRSHVFLLLLSLFAAAWAVGLRNVGWVKTAGSTLLHIFSFGPFWNMPWRLKVHIVLLGLFLLGLIGSLLLRSTPSAVFFALLFVLGWNTRTVVLPLNVIIVVAAVCIGFFLVDLGAQSVVATLALLAVTQKTDEWLNRLVEEYQGRVDTTPPLPRPVDATLKVVSHLVSSSQT